MNKKFEFELYINIISDETSIRSIDNLNELCRSYLNKGDYSIEVIDISKDPEAAIKNQILAIPTVIVKNPKPSRRYFGNLDNLRVSLEAHFQHREAKTMIKEAQTMRDNLDRVKSNLEETKKALKKYKI